MSAISYYLCFALDAGSEAIPALRDRLRKADRPEEKAIALTAIAYIGGPAAVSIIRSEFERNQEAGPALALTLASVNSLPNRRRLIALLNKSNPTEDWTTIQMAAFSLGVLRAREAINPLRELAER